MRSTCHFYIFIFFAFTCGCGQRESNKNPKFAFDADLIHIVVPEGSGRGIGKLCVTIPDGANVTDSDLQASCSCLVSNPSVDFLSENRLCWDVSVDLGSKDYTEVDVGAVIFSDGERYALSAKVIAERWGQDLGLRVEPVTLVLSGTQSKGAIFKIRGERELVERLEVNPSEGIRVREVFARGAAAPLIKLDTRIFVLEKFDRSVLSRSPHIDIMDGDSVVTEIPVKVENFERHVVVLGHFSRGEERWVSVDSELSDLLLEQANIEGLIVKGVDLGGRLGLLSTNLEEGFYSFEIPFEVADRQGIWRCVYHVVD